MLKLQDLMYFKKLADLKSFTKTSNFFNVSQPTISYAIKRIEEEFNIEIIVRDHKNHSIDITEKGQVIINHAEIIENELREMTFDINRLKTQNIKCGIPPIIGDIYFDKISINLFKNNLMDSVSIINKGSKDLINELNTGNIDIGLIGSLKPIKEDKLISKVIKIDNYRVIVSENHPFSQFNKISFKQLKNARFVSLNDHFTHSLALSQLCKNYHYSPSVIYKMGDLNLYKKMISEGIGIGILTESAIKGSDHIVSIPICDQNQPHFLISKVYRKVSFNLEIYNKIIDIFEYSLSENS
ncbi:LysR substrate-binding domain-containing protein [Staphylococcus epidermidis]|uniref:LysR substrate-binding domain-containing protein n=1 Tax=Staphylococcus epidermidis TaxID=1282 RepID=UPI0038B8AA88